MPKLSAAQKKSLAEATSSYHASLPGSPAEELLAERGLADSDRYRLGYVDVPISPEHDQYRGRLVIPYLRKGPSGWSVVGLKFRALEPKPKAGKYLCLPGELGKPRLFNTPVLLPDSAWVAVTEGELDALSASLSGVPAVGVPGAEAWQPHFREAFLGYETVYVLTDGDEAGARFGKTVAKALPNARIVACEPGEDVNSEMVKHGREFIRQKVDV